MAANESSGSLSPSPSSLAVGKKIILKAIVLGNSGVGKTSLLSRFVENKFTDNFKATVGADVKTKELNIDGQSVSLQLWDTNGMERFQALNRSYFRGANICLLVYDITNLESFESLPFWYDIFCVHAGDGNKNSAAGGKKDGIEEKSPDILASSSSAAAGSSSASSVNDDFDFPFACIGNKNDLHALRTVSQRRAVSFCNEKGGIAYYETSAKESTNVHQAFIDLARRALKKIQENQSEQQQNVIDPTINLVQSRREPPKARCACA